MTFYQWFPVGACALLLLALPAVADPPKRKPLPFGIVDLHVDLSYQVNFKSKDVRTGSGEYVAEWLAAAGVEGVVLPLYVPRDAGPFGPTLSHLKGSLAAMQTKLSSLAPYSTRGCGAGVGVRTFFAFEGAEPLGFQLKKVADWSQTVRVWGLVHAYDNALASSSGHGFAARAYGLSRRGKEVVRRVHASGGIIDVSHASDQAFADVLKQALAAERPVVATHSNSRALAAHPRNLTDPQLRQIAATGGVVGINFHSPFLLGSKGRARLEDVVRHIRHAVRIAGVDHVAIGSDFEGGIRPPKALADVRGFPRLARALLEHGLSRTAVAKIFGLNALRVLCSSRPKEPTN